MARTTHGSGRMIEQTSVQISAQRERWQAERELRYARRNRIRHIDRLLDELEMLNIAEETQLPADLAFRVQRLAPEMEPPPGHPGHPGARGYVDRGVDGRALRPSGWADAHA